MWKERKKNAIGKAILRNLANKRKLTKNVTSVIHKKIQVIKFIKWTNDLSKEQCISSTDAKNIRYHLEAGQYSNSNFMMVLTKTLQKKSLF